MGGELDGSESGSDEDEERLAPCFLGQQAMGVFFGCFFGFATGIAFGGGAAGQLPGSAFGASLAIYASNAGDKVSGQLFLAAALGALGAAAPVIWGAACLQMEGGAVLFLMTCAASLGAAAALQLAESCLLQRKQRIRKAHHCVFGAGRAAREKV